MTYYAYVRDDERDDHDYTCEMCAYFNHDWCELNDKKVDEEDIACECFEITDEYLGKTSAEID